MNFGIQEVLILAAAVVVLAVLVAMLLRTRKPAEPQDDAYIRGLELWLAGDKRGAVDAMRLAVDRDPGGVDPYLQLGNFLRRTGDARRAAALHRSLAARSGLAESKRLAVSLALAEDLIALRQWDEAGRILTEIQRRKPDDPRFWRARFHQFLGGGDAAAAADALKLAMKRLPPPDSERFRTDLVVFQLDRALESVRLDRTNEARKLVKDAENQGPIAGTAMTARAAYVRGLAQLADERADLAAETVTAGLLAAPDQSELLLPVLQKALLTTGHYERSVPILESACQSADAPPSLWIALAMLHEKLGDRELAVRLLEGKSADHRLTLAAAAPFLRILVNDLPDCDFKRIWLSLNSRTGPTAWHCSACGQTLKELRWVCPACRAVDTLEMGAAAMGRKA